MIKVCSIFSVAGKFCLAHGQTQLTRDTKSDVSCLQTFFTRRNEECRMKFVAGHHTTYSGTSTNGHLSTTATSL